MSGRKFFVLAIVLTISIAGAARADVWRVHADGSGDEPTIQAAINALDHGDTIRLADGVFVGEGNRDLSNGEKFFLIQSESGDPAACIIDCQGSPSEPHWGISFAADG
jgi:hypothetical protein